MSEADTESEELNMCNCSNALSLDCMLRLKHNQHSESGLAARLTCPLSKKTECFNKDSPLTTFSLRGTASLRAFFLRLHLIWEIHCAARREAAREKSTRETKISQGSRFIRAYWSKRQERDRHLQQRVEHHERKTRSHGCVIPYSLMGL